MGFSSQAKPNQPLTPHSQELLETEGSCALTAEALEHALVQLLNPLKEAVNLAMQALLQAERYPSHPQPFMESNHAASYLTPLWQALEHACLLGGKRLRPALFLHTYQALCLGVKKQAAPEAHALWHKVLPMAVAIELVHAQSLVLDDLPCMDNDELRRGYPTVHKAFGEATAVLSADALLALAFQQSSRGLFQSLNEETLAPVCLELTAQLADVAALQGLVNGQAADMSLSASNAQSEDTLYIYRNKTAALLRFCFRAAGLLAQAAPDTVATLDRFGLNLGLLFQLVDDRLDREGSAEALGKTPGKDLVQNKPTYPAVCGLQQSLQLQEQLFAELKHCLLLLEPCMNTEGLRLIQAYCLQRQH
jgi:geranylgeranyl pyrophosphate synthase